MTRCFRHPWVSVAYSQEESSIWSNYTPGTSPKGQGCPRGCRVQQEPRWQLMWALLYNIQLFQCLQTPELHNKTLIGGKRQQQPRLSQLRHLSVPLSCKRESHLCPLSSKPCLPSFSDSGASSLWLFSHYHKTSPSSYLSSSTHFPQEVP